MNKRSGVIAVVVFVLMSTAVIGHALTSTETDYLTRIRDQASSILSVAKRLPSSPRRTTIVQDSKAIIDLSTQLLDGGLSVTGSTSSLGKDLVSEIDDLASEILAVARTLPYSHWRAVILQYAKSIVDLSTQLLSEIPTLPAPSPSPQPAPAPAPAPAPSPSPTVSPSPDPSPSPSLSQDPSSSPTSSPAPSPSQSPGPSPAPSPSPSPSPAPSSSSPPPTGGYFTLQPVGSWSSLPGDAACAAQVHRSTWEIRPENYEENHTMPDPAAVHASFAGRPVASVDGTDPRWDTWLLPRVDGQFTGTTDEIFQWAACKWGLSDNLLRGIAVRESTWYEFLHFSDGSVYPDRGSGDYFASASAASRVFCNAIAAFGHDYQLDPGFGPGLCPKTFSIVGIMSWQDPAWGQMKDNQNGTFPFNRDSTAFALDYLGSQLRGCYEGWEWWLSKTTGDIWGCVGSWYSGDWHSSAADGYISRVQNEISNHTWLTANFADGKGNQYQCDPVKGCPI